MQLAEKAELSYAAVAHIESLRADPFDKTRLKLERALGVKIAWPPLTTNGSRNGKAHRP
jgi:ribosome-binding protein aMBF1 (putative translation factor)